MGRRLGESAVGIPGLFSAESLTSSVTGMWDCVHWGSSIDSQCPEFLLGWSWHLPPGTDRNSSPRRKAGFQHTLYLGHGGSPPEILSSQMPARGQTYKQTFTFTLVGRAV